MKLEHANIDELKTKLHDIVSQHVDLTDYKLFFFGSRTDGTSDERSDIDVGILGEKPLPPVAKSEIEEAIDNLPYLYKIEFVDFATVSDEFRQVALQHTEPIE